MFFHIIDCLEISWYIIIIINCDLRSYSFLYIYKRPDTDPALKKSLSAGRYQYHSHTGKLSSEDRVWGGWTDEWIDGPINIFFIFF